ncbi:MAG: YbhB/YbcL family Raf kinase inhibitor-like protein [Jiangellaceae bacterium]|nr:YbhB/YbcL family Raf kinase inhibitor-like protein [Jiangellaceae bacterium]
MRTLATVLACVALAGCANPDVEVDVPDTITVTSPAFAPDEEIPVDFSCAGRGASPPLGWTGAPEEARELALVLDDPDAPRGTFIHWIVFALPPSTNALAENAVPSGAKLAKNTAGRAEYAPPCPPSGTHHYRFTVYALRAPLDLPNGADTDDALQAVSDQAIAQGRLVGLFTAR